MGTLSLFLKGQKLPTSPEANVLNFDKHLINSPLQNKKSFLLWCWSMFFFFSPQWQSPPWSWSTRAKRSSREGKETGRADTNLYMAYPPDMWKPAHSQISFLSNYYYSNITPLPFLANLFAWLGQLTLWFWLLCASPSACCIYLNLRSHLPIWLMKMSKGSPA